MSKVLDLVNKFNNGEWDDISDVFGGDVKRFYSYVKRAGFLNYFDLDSIHYEDERFVNELMLYRLQNDPSYLNEIVQGFLSDVEIRGDGYYLMLSDLSELSDFFKDNQYSREYNDRDIVKNVLDEDWWEPYSDTVHDVYKDIVEELNERNMKLLAERVLELVGNQELSLDDYKSELFRDMSDDDGRFIITESNVMSVVEDEDSMNSLFKGDLNDLMNSFRWLGDEAYNQAYNDEVYSEVFDELSTYFEGKHSWVENKNGLKTVYIPYIKIKNIKSDIENFLNSFAGYEDTLFEYGDYSSMLRHYMGDSDDFLRIRVPDYPDNRKVVENINDGLPDRLYY